MPDIKRYFPDSEEFALQTVVVDALPNACTMARIENWRVAADEFITYLNHRGYTIVRIEENT